jgi:tetratricopeptide (TPR) repeat protein
MEASFQERSRHIIPRWRDAKTTALLGELDPSRKIVRNIGGANDSLKEKAAAWEEEQEFGFAVDLVGAAQALGEFEKADAAAKFILSRTSSDVSVIYDIADRIVNRPKGDAKAEMKPSLIGRPTLRDTVRSARYRLSRDPRNSIAWIDLSRAYISLGLPDRAHKAMRVGTSLAKANRFIMRSASRLAIHCDAFEFAHDMLRRSGAIQDDPWLLAAEIAAADVAGRTSRHVKRARELLFSGNHAPFHLSELASALASLELASGNRKKAKKLFREALREPTDNSLAQIEWASGHIPELKQRSQQFEVPFSHEAKARYFHTEGNWKEAVDECDSWLRDEPFSSRPATLGSYIAAELLENYAESERLAVDGLVASPSDPTLLNNLGFALANQGRLEEARAALDRINVPKLSGASEICYYATHGFLAFRRGLLDEGRRLYGISIEKASGATWRVLRARAALKLATEEVAAETPEAQAAVTTAVGLVRGVAEPDVKEVLKRLRKVIAAGSISTVEMDEVIRDIERVLKPAEIRKGIVM